MVQTGPQRGSKTGLTPPQSGPAAVHIRVRPDWYAGRSVDKGNMCNSGQNGTLRRDHFC